MSAPQATPQAPKRGMRFRRRTSTSIMRRDGVDHVTDVFVITAVRQGRVYYRADHGEEGIGSGNWYCDIEPAPGWRAMHHPGFAAHVAEYL